MIASADGCKAGWLVAVADGWPRRKAPQLHVCKDFQELLKWTGSCEVVVVDIPIGLPEGKEPRLCDLQARKKLGKGGSNRVFLAPPREALGAKTAKRFQTLHKRLTDKGAGLPVWGIVPKLREADDAMTPKQQERVFEFHPELAWARRAGGVLASKHGAIGALQRLKLLEQQNAIWLSEISDSSLLESVKLDDLLDAIVGLAVAEDLRRKTNPPYRLPAKNPPRDAQGLRMEIWY